MLPNPALKQAYEKLVWVYVYRDFSKSEADRLAERISLRFGVTSWPQIFLADPRTLEILAHTGRTVDSFLGAVGRTRVEKTRSLAAFERTRAAEERAVALEKRSSVKLARRGLDDDDIVVRVRALEVLAREDRATVVRRAVDLLKVESDPFRYQVCAVLKEAGDPKAAAALEALVADPKPSLNPNVVRIRAVSALATCGDLGSVDAIAPFATTGVYFNGLTGVAVDTLAALAKRHKKARPRVRAVLKQAYPEPPAPTDERAMRACVGLAKRIHRALGEKRPFPSAYNEKTRAALMR